MNILITGAQGFIGRNLVAELKAKAEHVLFLCDRDTSEAELRHYCEHADFVYHLAGVNRPQHEAEFVEGNVDFTDRLLGYLKKRNGVPVMLSSSVQATLDNPYGRSKRAGEDLLFEYGRGYNSSVMVFRFPNVFGKWSRPNYNSAIATFCHNIARDLPIQVNDPDVEMTLVYIDDVVNTLVGLLEDHTLQRQEDGYHQVPVQHQIRLDELVELIYSFKKTRETLELPNLGNPLTKKLYSTYLSFLPEDQFSYPLTMHEDVRGSFTEFIRTPERGQVSINISKPGITKGNHWHHTKNEKFLVVSGTGVIRFRKPDESNVIEYHVTGEKLEVVDIPTGYTHNIENLGDQDMVTVMWVNEPFNPEQPDTYFLEV